jgi:hypothetical protein
MILIIICVIIIIILSYFLFVSNHYEEKFGDPLSVPRKSNIVDLKNKFEDIISYDNDPNGRLGLDKCIENCRGYCVEYGQTGDAICFPVQPEQPKDFSGLVVSNDNKLSFPNVE